MESARFTHLNPGFVCEFCQKTVSPLSAGCRNHCPYCLTGKHVDCFPGDRANSCHGLMKAISYEFHKKKGLMLVFKCQSCGEEKKNKSACEDEKQADNYDKILTLSSSPPK